MTVLRVFRLQPWPDLRASCSAPRLNRFPPNPFICPRWPLSVGVVTIARTIGAGGSGEDDLRAKTMFSASRECLTRSGKVQAGR